MGLSLLRWRVVREAEVLQLEEQFTTLTEQNATTVNPHGFIFSNMVHAWSSYHDVSTAFGFDMKIENTCWEITGVHLDVPYSRLNTTVKSGGAVFSTTWCFTCCMSHSFTNLNLITGKPIWFPLLWQVWQTEAIHTRVIPGEQHWVSEWRGDGEVAVHSDHTQCFNAGCHTQHICGCPKLTHEVSELPALQQDVAGAKGYHNHAHYEVSNSQGGDEEVGDCLEALEAEDGSDHQDVTLTKANIMQLNQPLEILLVDLKG